MILKNSNLDFLKNRCLIFESLSGYDLKKFESWLSEKSLLDFLKNPDPFILTLLVYLKIDNKNTLENKYFAVVLWIRIVESGSSFFKNNPDPYI